jgi:hypothetical protein
VNTPREILLARHRGAMPALDAIRARTVASIASGSRSQATFIEFLVSLRWHAVAMSALWLLAALLGRDGSGTARGAISDAGSPPPLAHILALQEYRRQFAELLDPPPKPEPLPVPHACAQPRRRETEVLGIA